jgi:spore germination protein KB
MVLGPDLMKQFVVVCMQQVRSAQLTRYLPRYELIMVSFFVWGIFVQSVLMYWCSIYSLKQASGIKKDWMIIAAYAPILNLITNYLGKDHNRYVKLIAYPWSQISAALSIGLPLLLLTIIAMKKIFKRTPKGRTQASS